MKWVKLILMMCTFSLIFGMVACIPVTGGSESQENLADEEMTISPMLETVTIESAIAVQTTETTSETSEPTSMPYVQVTRDPRVEETIIVGVVYDDDLYGMLEIINNSIWRIGGTDVQIDGFTELYGTFSIGDFVEASISILPDGTLYAREIEPWNPTGGTADIDEDVSGSDDDMDDDSSSDDDMDDDSSSDDDMDDDSSSDDDEDDSSSDDDGDDDSSSDDDEDEEDDEEDEEDEEEN